MSVYNVVLTQLLNYYVSDNETQPVYTKLKIFKLTIMILVILGVMNVQLIMITIARVLFTQWLAVVIEFLL